MWGLPGTPETDWVYRRAVSAVAYSGGIPVGGVFLATENVAILYTDVARSTELSQRLSPGSR